jgi:hypothetical protein
MDADDEFPTAILASQEMIFANTANSEVEKLKRELAK